MTEKMTAALKDNTAAQVTAYRNMQVAAHGNVQATTQVTAQVTATRTGNVTQYVRCVSASDPAPLLTCQPHDSLVEQERCMPERSMCVQTRETCIECSACTRACSFLMKYDLDLKDFTHRPDLRYSCFMCDRCKAVCPVDLSGNRIAYELRAARPQDAWFTSFWKTSYKLRNNSPVQSKTLLFLGCNYPGYLPKTSARMIELCESYGIDFSIDCCKKPVHDSGCTPNMHPLDALFARKGVERVICCCPNCFHFLRSRYPALQIMDPYEFLTEIGFTSIIHEEVHVYFPCSERFDRTIYEHIKPFAPKRCEQTFRAIECCGAGGGAYKREPELVRATHARVNSMNAANMYTYCSTCAGMFHAGGVKRVKNFLSEILGVHEVPSTHYARNVSAFKLRKHRVGDCCVQG